MALYGGDTDARIALIRQGIPASTISRLSARMGMSKEFLLSSLGLSRATFSRKEKDASLLSKDESERVLGVETLIGMVQAMVERSGDPAGFDAARWVADWLSKPLPALAGATPASYMDTFEGQNTGDGIAVHDAERSLCMSVLWRIAADTPGYAADDLSGIGARITGGRWNSKGVPSCIAHQYCAGHPGNRPLPARRHAPFQPLTWCASTYRKPYGRRARYSIHRLAAGTPYRPACLPAGLAIAGSQRAKPPCCWCLP